MSVHIDHLGYYFTVVVVVSFVVMFLVLMTAVQIINPVDAGGKATVNGVCSSRFIHSTSSGGRGLVSHS